MLYEIGLSAALATTTLYYLWERLWARLEWGSGSPAENSDRD